MTFQATAQVEEGSKTWGKADWLSESTTETTSYHTSFKDFTWYLAGRALYPSVGYFFPCQALVRPESAEPSKLSMTIYIGGENQNYLIHSFKNNWQIVKHNLGRTDEWEWQGFEMPVAIGPADDAWTILTWVDVTKCQLPYETELSVLKREAQEHC